MSRRADIKKAGDFCRFQNKEVCKSVDACKWIVTKDGVKYCKSINAKMDIVIAKSDRRTKATNYAVRRNKNKATKLQLESDSDSDSDGYAYTYSDSDSDSDEYTRAKNVVRVRRLIKKKPNPEPQVVIVESEEKADADDKPKAAPKKAVPVTSADMSAIQAASAKANQNAKYFTAVIPLKEKFYAIPVKITNVGTIKVSTVLEKLNRKITRFVKSIDESKVVKPLDALVCVKHSAWTVEKDNDLFESTSTFFFAAGYGAFQKQEITNATAGLNIATSLWGSVKDTFAAIVGIDTLKALADKLKTSTPLSIKDTKLKSLYSAPSEDFPT